jgi:hypothetical protein
VIGTELDVRRIEELLQCRNMTVIPACMEQLANLASHPARLLVVIAFRDALDDPAGVGGYVAFLKAYARLRTMHPTRLVIVHPVPSSTQFQLAGYGDLVDAYFRRDTLERDFLSIWDRLVSMPEG